MRLMKMKIEIENIEEYETAPEKHLIISESQIHQDLVNLDIDGTRADYDLEKLIKALECFYRNHKSTISEKAR